MAKHIIGNFKYSVGSGNNTIADNLPDVTKRFSLSDAGYFDKQGRGARVIESNAPVSTAYELFNRLVKGYVKITPIPNNDGTRKGVVATMRDGTIITLRKKSSSDGSPAVDINIRSPGRVKTQKIHFVKKGE